MLEVHQQVSMQALNTLGVSSIAEHYCLIRSEQDAVDALRWAKQQGLQLQILGGGSNLVMGASVPGLVCHMGLRGLKVGTAGDQVRLSVAAGENWHALVEYAVAQNWWGIETLALIPGFAGAAPIQNIGAYGTELTSVVESVRVLDCEMGRIRTLPNQACEFGYRDSLFKRAPAGRFLVLGLSLLLSRVRIPREMYPDVHNSLVESQVDPAIASVTQIKDAVVRVRKAKLPDPQERGNVGSVFKNPIVPVAQADALAQELEGLQRYAQSGSQVKLSAAQLIDKAGCKSMASDGFALWPSQPLVIVNHEATQGSAFIKFADAIAARVEQRFGVRLQMEPQRMGL